MKNILRITYVIIMSFLIFLFSDCADNEDGAQYISFKESSEPIPLNIKNYLGNIENIHPKVLKFDQYWNGFLWWMAYTPYPLGNVNVENPCIAVSHDGLNWQEPVRGCNPLAECPVYGYNSDTHLVYNDIANTIECWWREMNEVRGRDRFIRRISKDGIHWTEPEEVFPYSDSGLHLSPAVSIINGQYVLLYCDTHNVMKILSDTIAPAIKWGEPHPINIAWGDLCPWHIDMINNEDNSMEMLVCAYNKKLGGNNNSADLFYVKHVPDSNFCSNPAAIMTRCANTITERSLYRSSLVKDNGKYRVYYSCIDNGWHRYMGLAIADSLDRPSNLKFIDVNIN